MNTVILPLRLMNKYESDRIQELCSQIAAEQDRQKFLRLVQELNRVLSAKDGRLQKGDSHRKED
ncbi:MAG: hypothetical protein WAU50_17750 [Candidatus Sulfotelmatobacter sp.]